MDDTALYTGTIIWFNPGLGFGFIGWEKDKQKQKDMFLHYSDLQCQGFKTINQGVEVQFKIGQNRNGDPKAIEVTQLVK